MGDAEHAVSDEKGSAADAFIRIALGLEDVPRGRLAVCCCWARFWVALVLVFPLRVLLLLLVVPLIWLQYRVIVCMECWASRAAPADAPADGSAALKPLSAAQRLVLRSLILPYRIVLLLFGVARVRVRNLAGKQGGHVSNATAAVVANHVSVLDTGILAQAIGMEVTGVAKAWLMGVPVMGTVLRAHHALTVGSDPGGSRGKVASKVAPEPEASPQKPSGATAVITEYQHQCARDPAKMRLLVFPEGTTHAARCLVKFRSGVFVAGEPVQPMALRYPPQLGWTDGLGAHVFGVLTRLFWTVEVIRLPVYVPSEAERSNPQLYADNVQAAIASALELPAERVSTTVGDADIRAWPIRQKELGRNRPL